MPSDGKALLMQELLVRRARIDESDAVAALFRLSRQTAMPYLPDLHTPEEDRTFFRERIFATCAVDVAERNGELAGFCAFREGWIDQFYVHPQHQRAGVGSALLHRALIAQGEVRLWTFQRNAVARRFYEKHGFRCVATTAGENEEHEPDMLYAWSKSQNESQVVDPLRL
jgi:putative acetyltransferase